MENNEEKVKKQLPKGFKRTVLISAITIALVLIFGSVYYGSLFEATDDAYVENHTVQVSPKVAGQIVSVFVTDNQHVKDGDLVAQIDDKDYVVKLEQASAN